MVTFERTFDFQTEGDGTIIDLTGRIAEALSESGITTGQMVIFVPGSTGALTTVEYEPGLIRDLPEFFERIIPAGRGYHHDATWGTGTVSRIFEPPWWGHPSPYRYREAR